MQKSREQTGTKASHVVLLDSAAKAARLAASLLAFILASALFLETGLDCGVLFGKTILSHKSRNC